MVLLLSVQPVATGSKKIRLPKLLFQVLGFELVFQNHDNSNELSAEHNYSPFICNRLQAGLKKTILGWFKPTF